MKGFSFKSQDRCRLRLLLAILLAAKAMFNIWVMYLVSKDIGL